MPLLIRVASIGLFNPAHSYLCSLSLRSSAKAFGKVRPLASSSTFFDLLTTHSKANVFLNIARRAV